MFIMKKNFLQDVIPPVQRRSIRDIPIPNGPKHSNHYVEDEKEHQDIHLNKIHKREQEIEDTEDIEDDEELEELEEIESPKQSVRENIKREYLEEKPEKKGFSKFVIFIVLIAFVAGLVFLNRTNAEVALVPKKAELNVSQNFDMFDKNKDSEKGIGIGYKKLEIQKSASISIDPSVKKMLVKKLLEK
jgi:hypothetical protein